MKCRHCGNSRLLPFADLQNCPPSNSMLTADNLQEPELFFPLVVEVCDRCFLAQVDEHKKATEIFGSDYTYFSSYSQSWLEHCQKFASEAIERFGLDSSSLVIEVASNDGYLLQYFKQAGIPVLGIEPTANTAEVAASKGIPTIVDFFGEQFAQNNIVGEGKQGDLICGNNVFAHVPDINDFTRGLKLALAPHGVVSLEFPHLLEMIRQNQFDTIYHEHFSYLSLGTTETIFQSAGLKIFDVDRLSTHGGSLRVYAAHSNNSSKVRSAAVEELLEEERAAGLKSVEIYEGFQAGINAVRAEFLAFLLEQRAAGKRVAAYGAAAKGNTLLNYCGIKGNELIEFVADLSPHKQNKYLPGTHIPVLGPEAIFERKPDVILILPWNLKDEITDQLADARAWCARFAVAIPKLSVF